MNLNTMGIITAAVLPALIFIFWADSYDRCRKEQRRLLMRLFLLGAASPVAALIIQLILAPFINYLPQTARHPANAFISAAAVEEGIKLAVMMMAVRKASEFDEIIDGAIYAVTVAMGFALLENILYVMDSGTPGLTALLRGVTAVPLHALAGGAMGLAVARDKLEHRGSITAAFLIAVLIHGIYNWILMEPAVPGMLIFPLLALGWTGLAVSMGRARKADLEAGRYFIS